VLVGTLAGLALFLVFVVMAVQYESLRNPAVIMLGVPFALIGVVIGLRHRSCRCRCRCGSASSC
jgi:multidrug efflux pump subunit AcrB